MEKWKNIWQKEWEVTYKNENKKYFPNFILLYFILKR